MLRRLASTHTKVLFARRVLVLSGTQARPLTAQQQQRQYSSKGIVNLDAEIESITDLATTAKDEMDFALESRNSVYYNEDKQAAHEAVDNMTKAYEDLRARLPDPDRKALETRIGIKIKEIQSAYEIMTLNDLEE